MMTNRLKIYTHTYKYIYPPYINLCTGNCAKQVIIRKSIDCRGIFDLDAMYNNPAESQRIICYIKVSLMDAMSLLYLLGMFKGKHATVHIFDIWSLQVENKFG